MTSSHDPFMFDGEDEHDTEDQGQRQTPSSVQRAYFGWIGDRARGVFGGAAPDRPAQGTDETLTASGSEALSRPGVPETRGSSEIEGVVPSQQSALGSGVGRGSSGGTGGGIYGEFEDDARAGEEEGEDEGALPTVPLGTSISSQARSHSQWPQSYRQSMDWYSYMPSPSIPKIFNPLLGHHGDSHQDPSGHGSVSGRGNSRLTSNPIPTRGGISTAGPSGARWAGAGENTVAASYPPKPQVKQRRRGSGRGSAESEQQSWQREMAHRQQRFLLPSPSYIMPFGSLGAHHRDHYRQSLHAPLLPEGQDASDLAKGLEGDLDGKEAGDGDKEGEEYGLDTETGSEEHTLLLEGTRPGCSFTQAVLNGVNVLAGVGVLSTPYALMQAGWSGLLLLLMLAAVCCFTGLVLRWCMDSQPGLETYPDIGEAAFGSLGRFFISIILYVELYACCVEFLILEGDNLGSMFPDFHLPIPGLSHLPPSTAFVLIAALAILPTIYLRDLSILSYISAGGVLASLVVVFSVFWLGASEVGFRPPSGPLVNPSGWPVAIGLFGFCYSGHAVFPNIYTSMSKPEKYNSVLLFSFVLCTCIYGGMAVMGFCMFGSDLQSQITLNLPPEYMASKVALWTTVVNPFTKYAISMTPVAFCLEELLPLHPSEASFQTASMLIRTALVVSTVAVALLVPFFGYVMAFIGSFLSMAVSVILPCACYLRLLGKNVTMLQRVACHMVIVFGFVCAIAGTYSSIQGIVSSLKDG